MIYLDYAANTPVCDEVLEAFCEASRVYLANPNASHALGQEASRRLDESTRHIADLLRVKENEIIYTSGATEANNLAIKGAAYQYKKHGKHIITTYLEHASVTQTLMTLQDKGYEIDFVDILANGLVDLEHLKELLREDTILVSISYVDSELGIKQPIEAIGALLKEYPHCVFHVDATQAVGKIPVSTEYIDLMTFAPHKFGGINGSGVLIKKENIMLEPLINGGKSTTVYRGGSPALALVVATDTALTLGLVELPQKYDYVKGLNDLLRKELKLYKEVTINSKDTAIPYILNISLKGINTLEVQEKLAYEEIYVATKAACSTLSTPSRAVYAITKDRKLALSTLRISLSHLTTTEEIKLFLTCFEKIIKNN